MIVVRRRLLFLSVLGSAMAVTAQPLADLAPHDQLPETLPGFAVPAAQAELSADRTARLSSRAVNSGAVVKQGTLLAQLDNEAQLVRVQIAEHRAAAQHELELARLNVSTAQRELDRFVALDGHASTSRKEVNDARDELATAKLLLKEAEFNQQQAEFDAALQRAILDEYDILAPFDGIVLEFERDAGETVEEGDLIVTIVQLDPLRVQIDCPLQRAFGLSVGAPAQVIPQNSALEPRIGKVTFVSAAADAGSQTVRVHIDVPNEDLAWPGGLRVNVKFNEAVARGPASQDLAGAGESLRGEERSNAR